MDSLIEFKQCSCGVRWPDREDFLRDSEIQPIGITFMPKNDHVRLYFFFTHSACRTTLAVNAKEFEDLLEEPIPSKTLTGTKDCPLHCTNIEDLEMCTLECRNAPYRRFLIDRLLKRTI
ncbi:MAG: hypothetical protein C4532_06830 [Candidatus Abyssobacteria bacterium SURF_17]|jgi:hypothetical protein|uniref:Uncharacterized protein n=1 Tax=Candidatus Abyssobacteria bacterium SURF_17 TaxID=2093361 RepID=A0A419F1T4_9BACT|nr:MAG: hypothetical protein C4532_06830 [Candidatus Abyssubacteria bacterium SURF_17]